MKVYATVKINDEIKLLVWPSKKAFEATQSWIDPIFINICDSTTLHFYEDFGEYKSMIIYTKDQIASHLLLKQAFHSRR